MEDEGAFKAIGKDWRLTPYANVMSRMMTIDQIAKVFGVSRGTLYKVLRAKGVVDSSRFPRQIAKSNQEPESK